MPLSESQSEFEAQILNLAKLLVDCINQEQLGSLATEAVAGEPSISRLERWLTQSGHPDVEREANYLRRVQRLRSKAAAHRKGTDYT